MGKNPDAIWSLLKVTRNGRDGFNATRFTTTVVLWVSSAAMGRTR